MRNLGLPSAFLVALLSGGFAAPAAGALIGVLEEPSPGADCAGIGNIRGWVYSNAGAELAAPLEVYIDGQKSIDLPCCSTRGDVRQNRPGAPLRTGFSGIFNFQLLAPGLHRIEVRARSRKGEELSLETACTSRRIGAATLLQSLDLDNDGAGYCETDLDDPGLVCCEGVRTTGPEGPQLCRNVCYRWNRATQSLVLSAGPVLENPLCRSAD